MIHSSTSSAELRRCTMVYSPDARRGRECDLSEVDGLLASGEWVQAPGISVTYIDGPDGEPLEIGRSLMTNSTAVEHEEALRLFCEDGASKTA